jgi:hypothetical protein
VTFEKKGHKKKAAKRKSKKRLIKDNDNTSPLEKDQMPYLALDFSWAYQAN